MPIRGLWIRRAGIGLVLDHGLQSVLQHCDQDGQDSRVHCFDLRRRKARQQTEEVEAPREVDLGHILAKENGETDWPERRDTPPPAQVELHDHEAAGLVGKLVDLA